MSCVILLGAGSSRGTLGRQAPVSAEFGEHLYQQNRYWCGDYPYLAAVIRFLEPGIPDTNEQLWALDKVWGAIDNRVKLQDVVDLTLPAALPPPPHWDPWSFAAFELRKAVARIYGAALDDAIQRAATDHGTVKQQLAGLQPGDCVISFNYDLLAERLLRQLGKRFVVAHRWLDLSTHEAIVLCKPHGSLNWKQQLFGQGDRVEMLDGPIREREITHSPCIQQPGIIAPVPFKSEIIFPELQHSIAPEFHNLLVAQWRCAIRCFAEAQRLIVMGYAFPAEDSHAQYLFAEAVVRRTSSQPLEIDVYEQSHTPFCEVMRNLRALFRSALYRYQGPVTG